MIEAIAGVVTLDGADPDPFLDAMLAEMTATGLASLTRRLGSGAVRLGLVALAPAGRPAALPDPVGARTAVADLRLWDRADPADPAPLLPLLDTHRPALGRLHGDFALADWRGGELLLARDVFGARPLHYTRRAGRWLAFASHPAALIAAGLARPALDRIAVATLPVDNCPPPGRFWQADIRTVPPAHIVRLSAEGARAERYWRLPTGPRLPHETDPAAFAAETRRLLDQAVRRRLPAAGPAGGHLSGGIDSSPIAVLAARAIRPKGRRFTGWSFEEAAASLDFPFPDEAAYVRSVADAEPNIDLVAVSEPGSVPTLAGAYDPVLLEPDGADVPEEQVLRDASRRGIDRVFSGWGGDQIVSQEGGYPAAELLLHGRVRAAFRMLRGFRARLPVALYYQAFLPLLPRRWHDRVARITGRGLPWPGAPLTFAPGGEPDPPADGAPPGRAGPLRRDWAERPFIGYRLARFQLMGLRHGIRYVYPLLDRDLVAHAMRAPMTLLQRDGQTRRVLRDAIEGVVPEPLRLREAKLFPHSLDALRFPRAKARFLARLAAIQPDGLARQVVDVPALAAWLDRTLRTPDEALAEMRDHAARGEQYYPDAFLGIFPIQLALALDDYERHWGRDRAAFADPD